VKAASWPRRWLRRLLVAGSLAYPVVLLACALGFYYVGERWWVTAAGLYAPRLPVLLPLPFTIAVLWATKLRRLLWTQAVAAFVALVPLMGFVFPAPSFRVAGAPMLRLLTFNVDAVRAGVQPVAEKIFDEAADIALLQEIPGAEHLPVAAQLATALSARFPYVESQAQFIVASRYRIESCSEPKAIPFRGHDHPSQALRCVIDTPLGALAVYTVHPLSPRGLFHVRSFRAVLPELETGKLLAGNPKADVHTNTEMRGLQISAAATEAARESLPVLLAGDTNLPGLSAIFRRNFSGFTDGFRAAGWGFGYTFPENHPFLRLDRILASDKLRFVSFQIDCRGVSDHFCLVADVQARQ
jgi:endonuclease/exonuclease/phosphatase family metal-dependent hydrolase